MNADVPVLSRTSYVTRPLLHGCMTLTGYHTLFPASFQAIAATSPALTKPLGRLPSRLLGSSCLDSLRRCIPPFAVCQETPNPGYTPEVFSHVLFVFRRQGSCGKLLHK